MSTAPARTADIRDPGAVRWGTATWWRWVSRTTLGEAAGFLFPVLVVVTGADDLAPGPWVAVLLLAGGAEGAVLGWAQSSVLATLVPGLSRKDWILRTALAAVVAWGIGMGPSTWAAGLVDLPTAVVVVLTVPAGLVLLGSIGLAQWTVLRRHVPGAARWIAWTAGAWVAALGVFTAVTTPVWHPGQGAATVALIGVLGGLLMAITMAAVTGAGLRRLLTAPAPVVDAPGPTGDDGTLHILMEDVGGTSWWAGVLTTLTSQSGSAQLRFVGMVDGERRYRGPTFPVPRTVGPVPPQEAWAPGMAASLRQVQRDVEADGWVQAGRGTEPWSFQYRRPAGWSGLRGAASSRSSAARAGRRPPALRQSVR